MQHCQTRVNKTKKYVNIVLYSAPNLNILWKLANVVGISTFQNHSKISSKEKNQYFYAKAIFTMFRKYIAWIWSTIRNLVFQLQVDPLTRTQDCLVKRD